jgi:hypothetical protein
MAKNYDDMTDKPRVANVTLQGRHDSAYYGAMTITDLDVNEIINQTLDVDNNIMKCNHPWYTSRHSSP